MENGDIGISEIKSLSGSLRRILCGRDDNFTDKSIDLRSIRSLMKFLKLAIDVEVYVSLLE